MSQKQVNLKFIQTDTTQALNCKCTPGNLTVAYNQLEDAVSEARLARQECNQTRSELDNARGAHNQTRGYINERQEAYLSAALRVKACREPLYCKMHAMQGLLTEIGATLQDQEDIRCYESWQRKLLRNNFICAHELLKVALQTYERIPEPALENLLCDHLQNCFAVASDQAESWPEMPQRWGTPESRAVADFLATCLAATSVVLEEGQEWSVSTLSVTGEVADTVSDLLRRRGWSVRKSTRNGLILRRRKQS